MSDTRDLLQRGLGDYQPGRGGYEQVLLRRDRKQRNRRLGSAIVAIAIAAIVTAAYLHAVRTAKVPATPPLGGWVVFSAPYAGGYRPISLDRGVRDDLFVSQPGGKPRLVVGHLGDGVDQFCPAVDPAGTRVAWLARGGGTQLDVASLGADGTLGTPNVVPIRHPSALNPCPEWSPTGDQLAVIDGSGVAILGPDGSVVRPGARTVRGVTELEWSPDGTMLALREGSVVNVIRSSDDQLVASTKGLHQADVGQLAWLSPSRLAIGTAAPTQGGNPSRTMAYIRIFDVQQERVVSEIPIGPHGWADQLVQLPDGRILYTDSAYRGVMAVDPTTGARTLFVKGDSPCVSPDGRSIEYTSSTRSSPFPSYARFELSLDQGTTMQLTPWSPGLEHSDFAC